MDQQRVFSSLTWSRIISSNVQLVARRLPVFLQPDGSAANPPESGGEAWPARHKLFLLLCVGIVLNLVSISAPGFFGPDAMTVHILQVAGRDFFEIIRGQAWLDFSQIHYRPLTFTLWGVLSFFLYETPALFHLSSVLLSVSNGILFYHLVLRISGQPHAAFWGFLAFNLFPPAAYVAGWVATVADKLYLMCTLMALHILLSDRNAALRRSRYATQAPSLGPSGPSSQPVKARDWKLGRGGVLRQVGVGLLCVLGLASKETMIPFPAFLAGLCLLVKPWRGWWWSLLVSSTVVGVYLWIRLPTMLYENPYVAPPTTDNVSGFALTYWLYPYIWDNTMLWHIFYYQKGQWWFPGFLSLLPVALLTCRRQWSVALAFIGYYYVFVAPVLVHCCQRANYLYGAVLPVAAMFAYALRRGERRGVRVAAGGLLAVLALHTVTIQWNFYERGVMQQRIYHSLAAVVREFDRRRGDTGAKFALGADTEYTWQILWRTFWPIHYDPARNIVGLNLYGRVTVHDLRNPGDRGPKDAVRLGVAPEGTVIVQ